MIEEKMRECSLLAPEVEGLHGLATIVQWGLPALQYGIQGESKTTPTPQAHPPTIPHKF